MNRTTAELLGRVDATLAAVDRRLDGHLRAPTLGEVGRVELVGEGIAQVSGLPHVRSEEIVRLGMFERAPVEVPLQTGLTIVDALVPVGRGQRELIAGDRQTGKTAIAVDAIVNQRRTGVRCVYCAIGARSTAVARVVADLRQHHALDHTVVVATTGEDLPGKQYIAPYAAMSIGEWFMDRGEDVLVVFDDLTRHSRAYRELSLLLRRPPGREAYPGDIFYIHSRLLERATHLAPALGGGSLTALPIVETEAEDLAAYIPTNLISMTDGQIYLSPRLFQQGVLPAVDVGRSVSRVGGRAQLAPYRQVTGAMRLSYAQFEELERFSRYGAHLEEERQRELDRGRRVREVLKQGQFAPLAVPDQIAVMLAVGEGLLDTVPVDDVRDTLPLLAGAAATVEGFTRAVTAGDRLGAELRAEVLRAMGARLEGSP